VSIGCLDYGLEVKYLVELARVLFEPNKVRSSLSVKDIEVSDLIEISLYL